MRTYQETLAYIKANTHQYHSEDVYVTSRNLDRKLEVVAFAFGVALADVINDYANVQ